MTATLEVRIFYHAALSCWMLVVGCPSAAAHFYRDGLGSKSRCESVLSAQHRAGSFWKSCQDSEKAVPGFCRTSSAERADSFCGMARVGGPDEQPRGVSLPESVSLRKKLARRCSLLPVPSPQPDPGTNLTSQCLRRSGFRWLDLWLRLPFRPKSLAGRPRSESPVCGSWHWPCFFGLATSIPERR